MEKLAIERWSEGRQISLRRLAEMLPVAAQHATAE
jgi:hypothetical protein